MPRTQRQIWDQAWPDDGSCSFRMDDGRRCGIVPVVSTGTQDLARARHDHLVVVHCPRRKRAGNGKGEQEYDCDWMLKRGGKCEFSGERSKLERLHFSLHSGFETPAVQAAREYKRKRWAARNTGSRRPSSTPTSTPRPRRAGSSRLSSTRLSTTGEIDDDGTVRGAAGWGSEAEIWPGTEGSQFLSSWEGVSVEREQAVWDGRGGQDELLGTEFSQFNFSPSSSYYRASPDAPSPPFLPPLQYEARSDSPNSFDNLGYLRSERYALPPYPLLLPPASPYLYFPVDSGGPPYLPFSVTHHPVPAVDYNAPWSLPFNVSPSPFPHHHPPPASPFPVNSRSPPYLGFSFPSPTFPCFGLDSTSTWSSLSDADAATYGPPNELNEEYTETGLREVGAGPSVGWGKGAGEDDGGPARKKTRRGGGGGGGGGGRAAPGGLDASPRSRRLARNPSSSTVSSSSSTSSLQYATIPDPPQPPSILEASVPAPTFDPAVADLAPSPGPGRLRPPLVTERPAPHVVLPASRRDVYVYYRSGETADDSDENEDNYEGGTGHDESEGESEDEAMMDAVSQEEQLSAEQVEEEDNYWDEFEAQDRLERSLIEEEGASETDEQRQTRLKKEEDDDDRHAREDPLGRLCVLFDSMNEDTQKSFDDGLRRLKETSRDLETLRTSLATLVATTLEKDHRSSGWGSMSTHAAIDTLLQHRQTYPNRIVPFILQLTPCVLPGKGSPGDLDKNGAYDDTSKTATFVRNQAFEDKVTTGLDTLSLDLWSKECLGFSLRAHHRQVYQVPPPARLSASPGAYTCAMKIIKLILSVADVDGLVAARTTASGLAMRASFAGTLDDGVVLSADGSFSSTRDRIWGSVRSEPHPSVVSGRGPENVRTSLHLLKGKMVVMRWNEDLERRLRERRSSTSPPAPDDRLFQGLKNDPDFLLSPTYQHSLRMRNPRTFKDFSRDLDIASDTTKRQSVVRGPILPAIVVGARAGVHDDDTLPVVIAKVDKFLASPKSTDWQHQIWDKLSIASDIAWELKDLNTLIRFQHWLKLRLADSQAHSRSKAASPPADHTDTRRLRSSIEARGIAFASSSSVPVASVPASFSSEPPSPPSRKLASPGQGMFKCPGCLHSYSRKWDMMSHRRGTCGWEKCKNPERAPPPSRKLASPGQGMFKCPGCLHSYSRKGDMMAHRRGTSGWEKCKNTERAPPPSPSPKQQASNAMDEDETDFGGAGEE